MKTAYDKPSVQLTKVSVLMWDGQISGKIITGVTKGHCGATSTCIISDGPLSNPGEAIKGHSTMAGGGQNFPGETKFFAIKMAIEKSLGGNVTVIDPYAILKKEGYTVVEVL